MAGMNIFILTKELEEILAPLRTENMCSKNKQISLALSVS